MGTNVSLYNLIILATLTSSSINLSYDLTYLMPGSISQAIFQSQHIEDWRMSAFNLSPQYTLLDDEADKMAILMRFSQNLIEYSVDLDSDIVDMVNENFWNLL